jgi:hypothetical protein
MGPRVSLNGGEEEIPVSTLSYSGVAQFVPGYEGMAGHRPQKTNFRGYDFTLVRYDDRNFGWIVLRLLILFSITK